MSEHPSRAADVVRRPRRARIPVRVLGAIALGGALGALGRHGMQQAVPAPGDFPLAILLANTIGCLLIGGLMVVVEQVLTGQVLLRPFLGIGVLGGFTTFSTYAVGSAMLLPDQPVTGLAYLVVTPVAALLAVVVGTILAETTLRAAGRRHRGEDR